MQGEDVIITKEEYEQFKRIVLENAKEGTETTAICPICGNQIHMRLGPFQYQSACEGCGTYWCEWRDDEK